MGNNEVPKDDLTILTTRDYAIFSLITGCFFGLVFDLLRLEALKY